MFTDAEVPVTSLPVPAFTNFTVWVCALFATQMRPSDETVSALAPTVSFIPTQPVKSLRSEGPFNAYPVRKAPDAGGGGGTALHWKFAVTVCGPDMVMGVGLVVPVRFPLQLTNVQFEAGVAVSVTGVPLL